MVENEPKPGFLLGHKGSHRPEHQPVSRRVTRRPQLGWGSSGLPAAGPQHPASNTPPETEGSLRQTQFVGSTLTAKTPHWVQLCQCRARRRWVSGSHPDTERDSFASALRSSPALQSRPLPHAGSRGVSSRGAAGRQGRADRAPRSHPAHARGRWLCPPQRPHTTDGRSPCPPHRADAGITLFQLEHVCARRHSK